MAAKQVAFDEEARESLKRGMDILAEAVRTTLGPKGRNVALDKKWGAPTVTHDGVTVAKDIDLKEPFENMGAQLLKEAASKTNDVAGDGTTTATVLAHAIVAEGLRNVAAGANPMILKKGIERAVDALIGEIKSIAKPVEGKEDIAHIATISAADAEIGELIAEVMDRVGKDGLITVEESKGLRFETEFVEGMKFDRGYLSPYFVTDPDRMEAILEEPYILIYDKKLTAASEILPVLEKLMQAGKRDILIIAEDVTGEALGLLVVNKIRGTLNVVAVRTPSFGERRKATLEDIGVLTAGQYISEETGRKLDSVAMADFGRARRVIVDKENTTIIEGAGSSEAIRGRAEQIKIQMEHSDSDYDREKLQERLVRLVGGVGIIKVGAGTEVELKEKKHRVEDALSATRAAVDEGIVPGGGVALLNAARALDRIEAEADEETGIAIVRRALEEPLRQIAQNSGRDGAVIIQTVRRRQEEQGDHQIGYDVMADDYCNVVQAGIVDPAKVTRSAVENAASIANMILTTGALITDIPQEETAPPMPPPEY